MPGNLSADRAIVDPLSSFVSVKASLRGSERRSGGRTRKRMPSGSVRFTLSPSALVV